MTLRRQRRHADVIPFLFRLMTLAPDEPQHYLQAVQHTMMREDHCDLDLAKKLCLQVKDKFKDEIVLSNVSDYD